MKAYAYLGIAVAILGLTVGVVWKSRGVSARSEALSCVSSLQAQCPSEDFLRSYNHWIVLRNQLGLSDGTESVVDREQRTDEFTGLTNRLQQAVPKGYTFDEVKRRFLPVPVPTSSVPPPVPPSVAAPAKK